MHFRYLITIVWGVLVGAGLAWGASGLPGNTADVKTVPQFTALARGPAELGRVNWLRDFDQAVENARRSQKPLLILFQEVPGCNVSTGYGREVLSHPLLVEAIESDFIPLAIFNNVAGADRRVLESFGEPAWNNPVVRIVDSELVPLTDRLAGDYTIAGLAQTMLAALAQTDRSIPRYLQLLNQEAQARQAALSLAVFGMPCFWSGEAALGVIEGVIDSAPGFMGTRDVVAVWYDARRIDYAGLLRLAKASGIVERVYYTDPAQAQAARAVYSAARVLAATEFRPDTQPQFYLHQTVYGRLPLTAGQAIKINAALAQDAADPAIFLSPRQRALAGLMMQFDELPWETVAAQPTIEQSWDRASALLAGKMASQL